MEKFRKKPVVIEAVQWDGTRAEAENIIEWMGGKGRFNPAEKLNDRVYPPDLQVTTLEDGNGQSVHTASPDDWIIKGVKGEFYPCKPDIFNATYEPEHVESQQAELERLRRALNYCVVLDNLYVGQDFTDNPQGSDAAHLRDIWRQMIEHVDCVLNLPSDAALNPPAAESGEGK